MFSYFTLRYRLYRLSRRAGPDASFVRELEASLFDHHRSFFLWKALSAVASVACFGLFGLVYLAETSSTVVPGTGLYPLRLVLEDTRLSLTRDPQRKEALQRNFLSRRIQEARAASVQGADFDPIFVERIVDNSSIDQTFDEETAVLADGLNELFIESETLPEAEQAALDRLAYDQALSLANEAIAEDMSLEIESSLELEENLL